MIRFAVIGTNTITDKFLQAASALPDFKLCAVYSRTLARAQEYAQKNNVSLVFDSLELTQTRSTQSTSPAPISAMRPRAS